MCLVKQTGPNEAEEQEKSHSDFVLAISGLHLVVEEKISSYADSHMTSIH